MPSALKHTLEDLLRVRRLQADAPPLRGQDRRLSPLPTGVAVVDELLVGGLPRGQVSEVHGPPSAGRTGLVLALASRVTRAGALAGWVDPRDRFDPGTAAGAGPAPQRGPGRPDRGACSAAWPRSCAPDAMPFAPSPSSGLLFNAEVAEERRDGTRVMYGGIHSPGPLPTPGALVDLAREFTPRVEAFGSTPVLLDLQGLGRAWPSPRALGEALLDAARRRCREPRVALAGSRVAALLVSQG